MQLSFLFLAFASLTFAQLWPLDFGDANDKSVGSAVWLEPGSHTALVNEDLSNAFVEFTFKPTFAAHTCEYRVISNDEILFSGSFRNSVATIIPSMLNTFPATTTEISVWTKGCSLNRFALPFTYGANGASVYLVDVSPTAQNNVNVSLPPEYIGFTSPNTPESYAAFDQWRFNGGSDDTSSFSTQVTQLLPQENDGWWFSNQLAPTSAFIVDYSDAAPFNSGSDFVLDHSFYTRWGLVTTQVFGCNATAGCSDYTDYTTTTAIYRSSIFSQNEETSRLFLGTWTSPSKEAKAATLKHQVVYTLIQGDVMKANDFGNSLLVYRPGAVILTVSPPYVKLWSLDSSATSDPNHVVVDLRTASGGGGLCTWLDPQSADPVYSKLLQWGGGGYPYDFISGGGFEALGPENTLGMNQGWFECPNDAAGIITLDPQPSDCSGLSNISKFDDIISINPINLDVSYPDGAFISMPIFDGGLKLQDNGNCFTPSINPGGLAPFYLSQVSNFDVLVDGAKVGEVKQNAIENNFVGRSDSLGTSTNFIVDPLASGPASLVFSSKPGFSMDFWPWAFIHKLPPPLCNTTSCVNGGVCLNPGYSTKCVTPSDQGGVPTETTNPYIPGGLTGLFTGDSNNVPVPYCTNNPCLNGGVCVENLNRFWNAELYGTGAADNITYCDCSAVNRTTVTGQDGATGPYWGDLCQYAPPCDASPCLNGGKCQNVDRTQYSCDCSETLAPGGVSPYTGLRCESSGALPCDSNPCGNGGTCVNDRFGSSGFSCNCAGGWSGHECDIPPVDNCLITPDACGEYGVCIPSLDQLRNYVQCACLFGYSGPTCGDPPAVCTDFCDNGGACISHPDSTATTTIAACLCPAPWVGDRCQWNSTIWATA